MNCNVNYEKKVAILKGGCASEREVSLSTGAACSEAISKLGYNVKSIDTKYNFIEDLMKLKPDIVFNALHGRHGEDGLIQGVLETMKIPYTHSGVLASSIAMDKNLAKVFFKDAGIPVIDHLVLDPGFSIKEIPFPFPYVIKPVDGGSSVGVMIFRNQDDWLLNKNFEDDNRQYLVEPYIPGRELTVATMGNKSLTVTDILSEEWYNYEAKYKIGASRHIIPANIPENIKNLCLNYALIAHKKLGCRGVTRTDFRWNEKFGTKGLFVLELNTQPGMTPTSLVPEQASYVGISFEELCEWLIKDASYDKK